MELQISIGYKKEDTEFIQHCSTSCIKTDLQDHCCSISKGRNLLTSYLELPVGHWNQAGSVKWKHRSTSQSGGFLHVNTAIELSNMKDLTRQLGTAGKEELLTYWSQKTKGSLPRPDKKILTVIIQNQEMRICCYWKEHTATHCC